MLAMGHYGSFGYFCGSYGKANEEMSCAGDLRRWQISPLKLSHSLFNFIVLIFSGMNFYRAVVKLVYLSLRFGDFPQRRWSSDFVIYAHNIKTAPRGEVIEEKSGARETCARIRWSWICISLVNWKTIERYQFAVAAR